MGCYGRKSCHNFDGNDSQASRCCVSGADFVYLKPNQTNKQARDVESLGSKLGRDESAEQTERQSGEGQEPAGKRRRDWVSDIRLRSCPERQAEGSGKTAVSILF